MSMKQKVLNMITEANTTTGESDTNLTDAVASLIDGYGGSTPTGTKTITDTSLTDVADYANAQVVDANLVAGNIKKGVNILGIEGTFEGGGAQYATGTFTLTSGIPSGYKTTPYIIVDEETLGFKPTIFGIKDYNGSDNRAVQLAMGQDNTNMWAYVTDQYYSTTSTKRHYYQGNNSINNPDIDLSTTKGALYYSDGKIIYITSNQDTYYSWILGVGTYTWYAYA